MYQRERGGDEARKREKRRRAQSTETRGEIRTVDCGSTNAGIPARGKEKEGVLVDSYSTQGDAQSRTTVEGKEKRREHTLKLTVMVLLPSSREEAINTKVFTLRRYQGAVVIVCDVNIWEEW
jgi:hypothetical protein